MFSSGNTGRDEVVKRYDQGQATKAWWPEAIKWRRLERRRNVVDRVARKIGVIGVHDSPMAHERLRRERRNRKITVENEPQLQLGMPTPERDAELAHMTTDPPLGRPPVLKRLDVEEKPDRRD